MLQKQEISIPFSGGIERDAQAFNLPPVKLRLLQNGRFVNRDAIGFRGGFVRALPETAFSGDNLGEPKRLSKADKAICCENSNGFHVADLANQKWRQVDDVFNRCNAELIGIHHTDGDVFEADVAGTSDLQCVVWSGQRGRVSGNPTFRRVFLRLIQNNVVIRDEELVTGTNVGGSPRVVMNANQDRFYIYWSQQNGANNQLKGTTISTANPLAALTVTTIVGNVEPNGFSTVDACFQPYTATAGGAVFVAYSVTGATVRVYKLSAADGVTILAQQVTAALPALVQTVRCVAISNVGATGRPGYAVWCRSVGNTIRYFVADLDNGVVPAINVFAIGATAPTGKIGVLRDPNNTTSTWVVWEENTQGTPVTNIMLGNYTFAGFGNVFGVDVIGNLAAQTRRGVGIAADPFVHGNAVYLPMVHYSKTQATTFVSQVGKTVGATMTQIFSTSAGEAELADTCVKLTANGAYMHSTTWGGAVSGDSIKVHDYDQIGHVLTVGSDVVYFPVQRGDGNRKLERDRDITSVGMDLCKLDFGAQVNFTEYGRAAVYAGADPQFFDGNTLTELGFELYPEDEELLVADGGVGTLPAGTYGVTVLYSWVDDLGVRHQSAPAVPVSATLAANRSLQITVPTLRITKKKNVTIEIYVTEPDGTLYYLIRPPMTGGFAGSGMVTGVRNVTNVDSITSPAFSFETNPSNPNPIQAGTLLSLTGGVIPPGPFPACRHVNVHQDRLVFAGCEDPATIQYTEERLGSFFPSTNAIYQIAAPREQGRVPATASFDDKLIVIQEKQLGVVFGRGPNRLGTDNQYSPVTKVAGNYGLCWENSNTVVTDADGVWFYEKDRGLRHLNRGLSISLSQGADGQPIQLGAEIDDLVSGGIGTGVFFPEQKQVRWCFSSSCFVYDCENHQWSTYAPFFNGPGFTDHITMNNNVGAYYKIAVDGSGGGQLFFENDGYFNDHDYDGTDLSNRLLLAIETAWIKLNTLQGYQRIYRALFLAEQRDSSGANSTLNVTAYTDYDNTSPDGSGSLAFSTSTSGNARQFEYRPVKQKCEAIKFEILVTPSVTSENRVKLVNLTLQVGVKRGTYKTSAAQRF